jgi:DNA segregation ATPase FtsK/SpoIIIE-like protein
MELRFKKFKGAAKKIEDYHLRYPDRDMPRILCVFDEFASIQGHGDVTKRISASVLRLTRLGRAVGIHMWLCTQQPDVKVIEGGIKTNLPLRMSGRMPTSSASVTVLGNSSAAALAAVAGRMILQLGPDPLPIQTPHISDEEIAESLAVAKKFEKPLPLEMGDVSKVIHEEWTTDRVVELSLKHLSGNISWSAVYNAASDDISREQARRLVEVIWKADCVHFEGKDYKMQTGHGKQKRLVEII